MAKKSKTSTGDKLHGIPWSKITKLSVVLNLVAWAQLVFEVIYSNRHEISSFFDTIFWVLFVGSLLGMLLGILGLKFVKTTKNDKRVMFVAMMLSAFDVWFLLYFVPSLNSAFSFLLGEL